MLSRRDLLKGLGATFAVGSSPVGLKLLADASAIKASPVIVRTICDQLEHAFKTAVGMTGKPPNRLWVSRDTLVAYMQECWDQGWQGAGELPPWRDRFVRCQYGGVDVVEDAGLWMHLGTLDWSESLRKHICFPVHSGRNTGVEFWSPDQLLPTPGQQSYDTVHANVERSAPDVAWSTDFGQHIVFLVEHGRSRG